MKRIIIAAVCAVAVITIFHGQASARNFIGAVESPPTGKMFTSGCAGFHVPWFAGSSLKSYWIGFQQNGSRGVPAQLDQAVVANNYGGSTSYAFGEHNSPNDDQQGSRIVVYPGDYIYECLTMTGITWSGMVTWYVELDDYTTGQSTTFTHTNQMNASTVNFYVVQEWADSNEPCQNLGYSASYANNGWDSIVLTVGDYTANYIQYINWPWDGYNQQLNPSLDSSPPSPNCSYYTYSVPQGEVIEY